MDLAAFDCGDELPRVVVLPPINVVQIQIVDDDVVVSVQVRVVDKCQSRAPERKLLVPSVGSFPAEQLVPVVRMPADDPDPTTVGIADVVALFREV